MAKVLIRAAYASKNYYHRGTLLLEMDSILVFDFQFVIVAWRTIETPAHQLLSTPNMPDSLPCMATSQRSRSKSVKTLDLDSLCMSES